MDPDFNKKEREINKIRIISEIDRLKVVANNHYLMKRYHKALKIAGEIIELAKSVDLKSLIKEQEEFISEINTFIKVKDTATNFNDYFELLKTKFDHLISENKVIEAHETVQNFIHKIENHYDLNSLPEMQEFIKKEKDLWNNYLGEQDTIKRKLKPLEIQINSYLVTNNFKIAIEILSKAKSLLKNLSDQNITKRWETLESMVLESTKQSDNILDIEKSIEKISNLTDSYHFEDAKNLLDITINLAKQKGLIDYERKLLVKKKSVLDAEEKYNKLFNDIKVLEVKVQNNLSNFLFEKAQDNCERIVKISRFIGKNDYVEIYSSVIDEIKQKSRGFNRLKKLKSIIKDLNNQGLTFLKQGNFNEALLKFKEIRDKLNSF